MLATGACTGRDGGGTTTPGDVDPDGGSIAEGFDLSGVSLSVSSKEFTESVVLGKITVHALRAAGAEVEDRTGLMGSNIARQALENGEVDLYWEYSGTGWTQHLGHDTAVQGEQEQFEATAEADLEENRIAWLGPAGFGNQYGIARAADAPGPAGGVDSLGELGDFVDEHPEEATFCGAAEFMDREWENFQQAHDAPFPVDGVHQMDLALNYVNGARSDPCNFAEVFTTDARIDSLDMEVLEDSEGYFTTELAALTARQETVEESPELEELADLLGRALTEDEIIELNGMVDLEGADADAAALHFLQENGFVG
ncbi:hypothetical protein IDM40_02360 [Nocardiopsis sp. HNM0947]|uniref:ABC-type glycine betaine transport system substrate-binding domain-containing protein n=1 Tax=Nocardiopsis coralli TaxID=2772213 RepID=A0ABR9P131_9ACTN|nr:hypothetical protein [Nocardiopsis coralli]